EQTSIYSTLGPFAKQEPSSSFSNRSSIMHCYCCYYFAGKSYHGKSFRPFFSPCCCSIRCCLISARNALQSNWRSNRYTHGAKCTGLQPNLKKSCFSY
ncbi:hypothetical protein S245_038554, partial [Arachis hypogaea]